MICNELFISEMDSFNARSITLEGGGVITIKISVLNAFLIGHHADDMLKFNETFSTYYFANQASTSNSYSY